MMRVALSKAAFEAEIISRFGAPFTQQKPPAQVMSTGIAEVDSIMGGLPRGAVTEIFGPPSSGRTSFMLAMLAHAIANKEVCTLIDTSDCFDPVSSGETQVDLDQLLWVRCAANVEHAFKATDLLLQGGGFGLVLLDLGDIAGKDARRIISSWWYRFRRTVENKPTAIVVMSPESSTRSCASLTLELNGCAEWIRTKEVGEQKPEGNVLPIRPVRHPVSLAHANLLRRNSIKVNRRRPITPGLNEVSVCAVT